MDASMKDAYQAKVRKVLYEFKNKTLKIICSKIM